MQKEKITPSSLLLSQASEAFSHWRGHRKHRGRIPDFLWTLAIRCTENHSLGRVSQALGLNHDSLKQRVDRERRVSKIKSKGFIELTHNPAVFGVSSLVPEGIIEFENPLGFKLRLIGSPSLKSNCLTHFFKEG